MSCSDYVNHNWPMLGRTHSYNLFLPFVFVLLCIPDGTL